MTGLEKIRKNNAIMSGTQLAPGVPGSPSAMESLNDRTY